jgi:tetratricopeptide (TPR) repeat protein
LYRESGDRCGQAVVLLDLGEKLRRLRVLDESRRLHEESLALHQELGNLRGIADADVTLAVLLLQQGALEEGERLACEGLVIYRQIDDLSGGASLALWFVGLSLYTQGRFAEALAAWEEYEAICHDLGASGTAVELVWARVELGQYDQARAAAQKALHISPKTTLYHRWIGCAFLELGRVALAEQDDAAARQLIQQALPILQEMRYDEDVGLALSMSGIVALRLGQLSDAQRHLADALRVGIEAHMPFTLACATAGIALLLARRGEVERAVELYALASRDPLIAHSRWYEDVVGRRIAAAATALPPDIIAAAQDRGRARDLWATVEELAAELG